LAFADFFGLALSGACGFGGVFSIRRNTSSSLGGFAMPTPMPMPKHVETIFYHAIGGIVIRYAYIDAIMATLCDVLFTELGGYPGFKEAPQCMSKRLGLMGKCFRNKPELADLKGMAENLRTTIKEIDLHRAYIVHGCMTEYSPNGGGPPVFQFTKVDPKESRDGYDQTSITLTQPQLAHIAQACTQVVRGLRELTIETKKVAATQNRS
jgi:hypothetical protein